MTNLVLTSQMAVYNNFSRCAVKLKFPVHVQVLVINVPLPQDRRTIYTGDIVKVWMNRTV